MIGYDSEAKGGISMLKAMNPLKNMKVGLKLGAVIFFMLIPILSLMGFLFTSGQKSVQFSTNEAAGAGYLTYLKNIELKLLILV